MNNTPRCRTTHTYTASDQPGQKLSCLSTAGHGGTCWSIAATPAENGATRAHVVEWQR